MTLENALLAVIVAAYVLTEPCILLFCIWQERRSSGPESRPK